MLYYVYSYLTQNASTSHGSRESAADIDLDRSVGVGVGTSSKSVRSTNSTGFETTHDEALGKTLSHTHTTFEGSNKTSMLPFLS